MRDERFDVVHRAFFHRRRGQRVVGLVVARRHVVQALLDDARALAHFLDTHFQAILAIAVHAQRHVEIEVLVAGVGAGLAQVEVHAGRAQAGAGDAPVDGLVLGIGADMLRACNHHLVGHDHALVLGDPRAEPVDELADLAVPAARQVHRETADTEERRMHAKTADRLDHVVGLLAVREHPENRAHEADILDIGAQKHQMAGDAKELAQHDPRDLHPFRHLNAERVLEVHDVRQLVHDAAEIVDPVGIRDIGVPGLALAHLFGAAMVIADVRHRADDLFAVELQHHPEHTVHGWMVRAHVEEHELAVGGLAFHAPVFRLELERVFFLVLAFRVQMQWLEFGRARGVILAQRMAFPGRRHHDAAQIRVAVEHDAEHVPDFALVPVGVGPDAGRGRGGQVVVEQRYLEPDLGHRRQTQQVIDDREVAGRLIDAVLAHALVDRGEIEQHAVAWRGVLLQKSQHLADRVAADPERGRAVGGDLRV